MADGNQIGCEDVGLKVGQADEFDDSFDLRKVRDQAEKQAIVAALGRVNGNVAKASELLGVSRPTLYDLMHRLGLK
jgi:two-component system NtrC family response regulator